MPAHRKPALVQELTGAWAHNPDRRRKEIKVDSALGAAPGYFARDERAIWKELSGIAVPGVLTGADRWTVETLCLLMAKQRRREAMKVAELALIARILGTLGMTPADRSKVGSAEPEPEKDDPFGEFL